MTAAPDVHRRRPRPWAIAAVAASTLAVTAAVDGVVGVRIEGRIAARAACALHAEHVSASLRSLTTLPHLLTGNLGTVDVRAHDAHPQELPVDIAATLDGVRTDGRVAGTHETVTASYADVLAARGGDLTGNPSTDGPHIDSLEGDGTTLRIHVSLPQLPVPVVISASLSAGPRSVTVTPVSVEIFRRSLPVAQLAPMVSVRNPAVAGRLGPRRIPLDRLPAAVDLVEVTPAPGGLVLQARTGPLDRNTAGAACS